MSDIEKLYTGVFIAFAVIAIVILLHFYNKEETVIMDLNNDGTIDNFELSCYINREIENRAKKPPAFKGLIRNALSGALRGGLTGLILSGTEGALTSALVFAVVSPIMSSIEYRM